MYTEVIFKSPPIVGKPIRIFQKGEIKRGDTVKSVQADPLDSRKLIVETVSGITYSGIVDDDNP